MPELTPEQAIEQLRKLPEERQRAVLGRLSPEIKQGILTKLKAPADFTANPKGEGLYRMSKAAPGGWGEAPEISVPYSKVQSALSAGLRLHPDEIARYQKDVAHQGEGPTFLEKAKAAIEKGLEPTPGETPQTIATQPGGLSNKDKAALRVLYNTPGLVKDLYSAAKGVVTGEPNSAAELTELVNPFNVPEGLQKQFQADWAKDKKLAADNLIGTLAGLGLVAAATHGAGKVMSLPEIRAAAEQRFRGGVQRILGFGERPTVEAVQKQIETAGKERLKTARAAREAGTEYERERAAAKAETQKTIEAHRDRVRTEKEIEDTSKQLAEKHEAAKAKANAENDKAWDTVREKTADVVTDVEPLKQVVQAAKAQADPASSPLFNSILREGEGAEEATAVPTEQDEQGRPIVNGQVRKVGSSDYEFPVTHPDYASVYEAQYGEPPPPLQPPSAARRVFMNGKEVPPSDPKFPEFYQAQYGEPPPLNVGGGPKTNFARLQRWYTYLDDRMYSGGRMEAGTYNALKMMRQAVDDAMGRIAKEANATSDLAKARKLHQNKMEAFYDSPNQPTTVASKSFQETAPEFQKEQGIKNRRKKLGAYDPAIESLSVKLDKLREAHGKLPKEAPFRKQITPMPERPKGQPLPLPGADAQRLPQLPVNVQQLTAEMIRNAASRWRATTQYQIRRLVASGIGGAIAQITGHGQLEGAAAGYLLAEFAPKVAAALVERPKVIEWLSRPTEGTIEALRSLPDVDKVKIIEVFKQVARQEQAAGRPIKIAPVVAAFLAGGAAARQPTKSLKELRDEAQRRLNQQPKTPETPAPTP
jgi:hypothetical protein